MTPADYPDLSNALCDTCRRFGERGWCRATSGNFSVRIDSGHSLITQSGKQKARLSADDLMICRFDGTAVDNACQPSAETPVHHCLYELDESIGAVLHTHSVAGTLLSKHSGEAITVSGYEMQKALAGVTTHETNLLITVFANDQDMDALAKRVGKAWRSFTVPGFLIAGHGLYTWGQNLDEAERHVEGFEFLFKCLWQERLAGLS